MNKNLHISSLTVSPLKAPLIMPFRVATGSHQTLDNLLLKLTLKNDIIGYGEAAVATHITGETIPETLKNLKDAAKFLKNKNIADYLSISNDLKRRYPKNPCVRAAVETALFDALTKHLNIPLWKFFGNKPQRLASDITIVIGTLEETIQQTQYFYNQGFRAFKIKIGKDEDLDLKRVIAIHAIAKKSRLFLDANQGFDARQTMGFLKQLQKRNIKIDMVEQPVRRDDWDGLVKVTRESKIPICADESARSLEDVLWIIKNKAADVVNIKTMKTGIIESREIAFASKSAGLKLMIGGMMESSLAMTASAHLAAGLGGFDYIDLDTPFFIKEDQHMNISNKKQSQKNVHSLRKTILLSQKISKKKNPFLSSKGIYQLSHTKPGIGIHP